MAIRTIDRTGEIHGRLRVICRSPKHDRAYWICACDCGESTTVRGDHLKEGRVQSCGCIKDEQRFVHGMSRTPEYVCWMNMKQRCINPADEAFKNYGDRGISFCPEWSEFAAFFADMGPVPAKGMTLERVNNDDGYSKSNCIWATRAAQVRNRRNSLLFTHEGKTLCLKDWCTELGVSYCTARYRIKRGRTFLQSVGIE